MFYIGAMQQQTNRRIFLGGLAGGIVSAPSFLARPHVISKVDPYFTPPAEWRGKFGEYRSLLIFNDGSKVETLADWVRRRAEIREDWMRLMGQWPKLITEPKVAVLEKKRRENFRQLKVRFIWTPVESTTGYLLIPDSKGKRPAVVTVYYEPESAAGLRGNPFRDYALQLVRRGFVALSIGSTETTNNRTYASIAYS